MNARYWLVIPAAGIGKRMQSQIPKQYLTLLDQPVITHTLSRLLSTELFAGAVVALHPDDQQWAELDIAQHPKIITVVGGDERSDSVAAALAKLDQYAEPDDWVLVHDAARPCVCTETIKLLIETLASHPVGGILAIPASDTLKRVEAYPNIDATVDRSQIWQAQTPQMFRKALLAQALEYARVNNLAVTDEASAIELFTKTPQIVEGRRDNIKITHPDDLWLAEMILTKQQENSL